MYRRTYRESKRANHSTVLLSALLLFGAICAAGGAPANLDPTFGGTGIVISPYTAEHDYPYSMAVQADGKILVAGLAWDPAFSLVSSYIVRHLPTGGLDPSFGVDGKLILPYVEGTGEYRYRVVVQPDGKILACGGKENGTSSNTEFAAFRYNSDGTLDDTFGTGGKVVVPITGAYDEAYDLALQPDGKIVLFGYSFVSGNGLDFSVARLNANGSIDDTFDTDGRVIVGVSTRSDIPGKVLVQPDGKLVLVGTATVGGAQDNALVRLNANGSLDPTFGDNGIVINSIAAGDDVGLDAVLQDDGKIITSGGEVLGGGGTDVGTVMVRYNVNGSVDTSFATNGVFTTGLGFFAGNAIALQSDGKIIGFGFGLTSGGASSRSSLPAHNAHTSKNPLPGGIKNFLGQSPQTNVSGAGAN